MKEISLHSRYVKAAALIVALLLVSVLALVAAPDAHAADTVVGDVELSYQVVDDSRPVVTVSKTSLAKTGDDPSGPAAVALVAGLAGAGVLLASRLIARRTQSIRRNR